MPIDISTEASDSTMKKATPIKKRKSGPKEP
jgi:hypothetical protein